MSNRECSCIDPAAPRAGRILWESVSPSTQTSHIVCEVITTLSGGPTLCKASRVERLEHVCPMMRCKGYSRECAPLMLGIPRSKSAPCLLRFR